MDPKLWGPSAWYFLHSVTFSYPENPTQKEKKSLKDFFRSLEFLLPCDVCKLNFKHHFNEDPIDGHLNSREEVIKWLINIHNKVNIETGKPILSYETVLHTIPPLYSSDKINICRIMFLVILLFVLRKVLKS